MQDSGAGKVTHVRALAAHVVAQVMQGNGLSDALARAFVQTPEAQHAFLQALCYSTLRWQPQLSYMLERLLDKPLPAKHADINALALVGLCQMAKMSTPAHAVVHATVAACRALRKPFAAKLINALLRRYQRESDAIHAACLTQPEAHYAHPAWLLEAMQRYYPSQWQRICAANNRKPPLSLRVNCQQISQTAYQAQLQARGMHVMPLPTCPDGLIVEPCAVSALPGYQAGWFSVQDGASQRVAPLLDAQAGDRVLDACAAPGGKTSHILERQPDLHILVALDSDPARLARITENCQRLRLPAPRLVHGDAANPNAWWDGQPFDRILVDAPCSATGIIRRHPDIKCLRRAADVQNLAQKQRDIIMQSWSLLKPGGRLVYTTCSILPDENDKVVEALLSQHRDAKVKPIAPTWGSATNHGRVCLPGEDECDGFYYAMLTKAHHC